MLPYGIKKMSGKIEYIYLLYFMLDGVREYFYCGRSENTTKRLSGHRSSAAGHRDNTPKYQFIHSVIIPNGYDWGLEVVKEIPADVYPYDYEDWYVIKYIREGYLLQNAKHGDLEKRINDRVGIRNVKDVQEAREKVEYEKEHKRFEQAEALRNEIIEKKKREDNHKIEREKLKVREHNQWIDDFIMSIDEIECQEHHKFGNLVDKLKGISIAKRIDRLTRIRDKKLMEESNKATKNEKKKFKAAVQRMKLKARRTL